MQIKFNFFVAAFLLLSVFALFSPHSALAQTANPANIPTGAGIAPSTADADCEAVRGTANDPNAAYFTNKAAHLQRQQATIQTLSTLYPIANAMSACVQNIMNIMQKLPQLANPLNIGGAIITQLIVSVVNSTCSQIMGTITSLQTSLTNLTKICLPLPKFNGLDLPTFNAPSCSGGITISPISGWSANPPTAQVITNPHLN